MSDLVERLRAGAIRINMEVPNPDPILSDLDTIREAADTIENLVAEVERLRYHARHAEPPPDACDICEGVTA